MVIKTHRKGKRSAFKKFRDSLCLKKKHIGREREVLLKSFEIVRPKQRVREFGVAIFLVKKKLMY
jgi:hypothetical protein